MQSRCYELKSLCDSEKHKQPPNYVFNEINKTVKYFHFFFLELESSFMWLTRIKIYEEVKIWVLVFGKKYVAIEINCNKQAKFDIV